ncbi:MAG: ABC transporter substrate-binding protein [Lautropia sp.]
MTHPTRASDRSVTHHPNASRPASLGDPACRIRRVATALATAAALLTSLASLTYSAGAGAQTLTVGVRAGPLSLDPHFSNIGPHAEALKNIFDTLVWAGDDLQIEPRLAESWKVIDDVTWEFKLRRGVKFHDGSDFTAEDVRFSIARIPLASGPSSPTTTNVRRVKGVTIVDPYTIRVTTDGPAPTLINDFNRLFIVSSKAAKDYSTRETADAGFNSGKATIGTGPYKFVSWTPKEQLVLERFDDYWGGKEPWQRVFFKEVPNDSARVAQLKAGQLDLIVRVPAADVLTLERDPKIRVVKSQTIYVFNLEFDMRQKSPQVFAKNGTPLPKNPFLDPRVREAVSLAIDRPAISEIAMEGLGTPANQFVPPSIFGHNKSLPPLKTDLAAARKLMAEAGYPDGFRVGMAFTNDRLPGDRQVGTTLAQMLARIGLEVQANSQPVANFLPARNRGEYSMAMMGMGAPTGEAQAVLTAFIHSNDPAKKVGTFSWSGYLNPKLDKMIEDAGEEMDVEKRRALLNDALTLVAQERTHIPIAIIGSAWAMQRAKVDFKPRVDEDTMAMNMKAVK